MWGILRHLKSSKICGKTLQTGTRDFLEKIQASPLPSAKCIATQPPQDTVMNVFDRKTKRLQKNYMAKLKDYQVYDYVHEEAGWRLADRVCDVKRKFETVVDLGCRRGHVSKHIYDDMAGKLYMCDMAEKVLEQAVLPETVPVSKVIVDEEFIPFKDNSIDLFVSSLSLHWVNNLPSTFKQVFNSLKPDGAFIGCMFGGETLFELRVALQLTETELEGGFAPHVSPFTEVRDLGNLLNRAGYTLLTIDIDDMIINYPSMIELMEDLKGMGESNCAWKRKLHLRRSTTKAAAEKYKEMYGNEDGTIPATYQMIYFIGWKPDSSQKRPAKRGSGQVSIKDIDHLEDVTKQVSSDRYKTENIDDKTKDSIKVLHKQDNDTEREK
ncbi:unnamed protein product [Owenia fusiformis]|uniref:Arginine-hydroxylase NDUFAF5, mitochondrial n=1 Tax=Owenia fusiformis TaxID=6347 RepID=A0A8S4PCH2_OWEFU|nr:unnamed protein product [Owenia fusiformis]